MTISVIELWVVGLLSAALLMLLLIYGRLNRMHEDYKKCVVWNVDVQREIVKLLTEALAGEGE